MPNPGLLAKLSDYASSVGYTVVIDDTSDNPDLVFVRSPEGAIYSISVQPVVG